MHRQADERSRGADAEEAPLDRIVILWTAAAFIACAVLGYVFMGRACPLGDDLSVRDRGRAEAFARCVGARRSGSRS